MISRSWLTLLFLKMTQSLELKRIWWLYMSYIIIQAHCIAAINGLWCILKEIYSNAVAAKCVYFSFIFFFVMWNKWVICMRPLIKQKSRMPEMFLFIRTCVFLACVGVCVCAFEFENKRVMCVVSRLIMEIEAAASENTAFSGGRWWSTRNRRG